MRLGEVWGCEEGKEVLDVVDDVKCGGWIKEAMVGADEEDAVLQCRVWDSVVVSVVFIHSSTQTPQVVKPPLSHCWKNSVLRHPAIIPPPWKCTRAGTNPALSSGGR